MDNKPMVRPDYMAICEQIIDIFKTLPHDMQVSIYETLVEKREERRTKA